MTSLQGSHLREKTAFKKPGHNGTGAQWDGDTMGRGHTGTGAQWDGGTMGRGHNGTGAQWDGDTMGRGHNEDRPIQAHILARHPHEIYSLHYPRPRCPQ